jgi:hypothetical protein
MRKKKDIVLRQHEVRIFLQCRRKFDLYVNKRIVPAITKDYLEIGGLFDDAISEYFKGHDLPYCLAIVDILVDEKIIKAVSQDYVELLENIRIIVQGMLTGYIEKFKPYIIKPHYHINVPIIPGYRLSCELDGLLTREKELWIVENKTTAQIDTGYIKKLNTDFQMNCYFYGLKNWKYKQVSGVLYRVSKKPTIRQRQKETSEQFRKRLMLEYIDNVKDYFYEEEIYKDHSQDKMFEKDIIEIFKDIEQCKKQNRYYASGEGCSNFGGCQYLLYCNNPNSDTLETFYKQREF